MSCGRRSVGLGRRATRATAPCESEVATVRRPPPTERPGPARNAWGLLPSRPARTTAPAKELVALAQYRWVASTATSNAKGWPVAMSCALLPSRPTCTTVSPGLSCPCRRGGPVGPRHSVLLQLPESGRQDLNLRPSGPQPDALPDCATPRRALSYVRFVGLGCERREERATGLEPVMGAWKAPVLPLHHARARRRVYCRTGRRSSVGTSPDSPLEGRRRPGPEPVVAGAVERDRRAAERAAERRCEQRDQPGVLLRPAEALQRHGAGGAFADRLRVLAAARRSRSGRRRPRRPRRRPPPSAPRARA